MQSLTASSLRLAALACAATTAALLIIACKSSTSGSAMTASAPAPASITCAAAGSNAQNPAAPTAIDSTCSQLHFTPATQASGDGPFKKQVTNQQAADMYSWLSFVAVNWPANPTNCTPDASTPISKRPTAGSR